MVAAASSATERLRSASAETVNPPVEIAVCADHREVEDQLERQPESPVVESHEGNGPGGRLERYETVTKAWAALTMAE